MARVEHEPLHELAAGDLGEQPQSLEVVGGSLSCLDFDADYTPFAPLENKIDLDRKSVV